MASIAGRATKVVISSMLIASDNKTPIEAAPLCGLSDSDAKVPMVVNPLITTAREVLDASASDRLRLILNL